MKQKKYLLDTHALVFWVEKQEVSPDFIDFFDRESEKGKVLISSASLWEIALLKKKGRLQIKDIHQWKNDLLSYSNVKMTDPTASDMIDSTLLPDFHNDPFDRLFIAQAINNKAVLVSRDKKISDYTVETFWK